MILLILIMIMMIVMGMMINVFLDLMILLISAIMTMNMNVENVTDIDSDQVFKSILMILKMRGVISIVIIMNVTF